MRRSRFFLLLALVSAGFVVPLHARDALFRRGDSNQDGKVDLSDATHTLGFLFLGTGSVDCRDAADANDDGGLDIADPLHALGFLFVGTARPPAPFDDCGADPSTDGLDCDTFAACEQPPPAGEGLFGEPASYSVAAVFTTDVALADLDGDGVLDLVITQGQVEEVSIGLGRGDGTFGEPVEEGVRRHARSVAVGDLDGDGALDVVVGSQEDVTVLPGAGDGTFGEAASYDFNRTAFVLCVALDDLDGDGVLDLAVATPENDEISVLPGVGDGTFGDPVAYPISGAESLAIGDLDGDRVLDLVVAGTAGVSVLRGVGDGTFGEPSLLGGGEVLLGDIALGDLDGDGALDIALVRGIRSSDVFIFLGRGDGTFADPVRFGVGTEPQSVALGDLDRDGTLDLAVTNGVDDGNVSILIGVGDGTFCDAVDFPVGERPWSVALGDLDGDGALDLVTANGRGQDVSILLSR